jgi:hypothetical protein
MALAWTNWDLAINVISLTQIPGSPPSSDLANITLAITSLNGPLTHFSTRGFTIGLAGATPISLDASVYFGSSSTMVTVYQSGPHGSIVPPQSIGALPALSDSTVSTSYDFANAILTNNLSNIPIPLQGMNGINLTLSRMTMSGGVNALHASGYLAEAGTANSFSVSVDWSGVDLALSAINITANHRTCASGDIACVAANSVLDAIASTLGAQYSAQYIGSLFRPTNYADPVNVTLLGVPMVFHIRTLAAAADSQKLVVQQIVGVAKQ